MECFKVYQNKSERQVCFDKCRKKTAVSPVEVSNAQGPFKCTSCSHEFSRPDDHFACKIKLAKVSEIPSPTIKTQEIDLSKIEVRVEYCKLTP